MTLTRAAAAGYGALLMAVVVAPALVVRSAGERGGAGTVPATDLLLVSTAGGVVAALLAWRALADAHLGDPAGPDRWIAALCALAVLAPGATLVPAATLHVGAGMTGGGPVMGPVLWGVGLVVAGGSAVALGRLSCRWLARGRAADASGSTDRPGRTPS